MTLYVSKGNLTGAIEQENLAQAQAYLSEDNMTDFIDESIAGVVLHVYWTLTSTSTYTVTAVASRDLTDDELRVLSEWTSGQNSDGLGEGFEQQEFCWEQDEDEDCYECNGTGSIIQDDEGLELSEDCSMCGGSGTHEADGHMISFDWKTNDSVFEKVS